MTISRPTSTSRCWRASRTTPATRTTRRGRWASAPRKIPTRSRASPRPIPSGEQLVEFFSSDAFVYDARETLAEALVNARGLSGRKPWYNCTRRKVSNNWLRYQLQEPVRTTYQFSLLPRDGAVVPHADAPRKLVSLLLYFRDPDWKDAWGGGTEFYVPLDPAEGAEVGPDRPHPLRGVQDHRHHRVSGQSTRGVREVRQLPSRRAARGVSHGDGSQGPPGQHQASQVVQETTNPRRNDQNRWRGSRRPRG